MAAEVQQAKKHRQASPAIYHRQQGKKHMGQQKADMKNIQANRSTTLDL